MYVYHDNFLMIYVYVILITRSKYILTLKRILRIPSLKIIPGETLKETDFDIIDDPAACKTLDVSNIPISVTLSKVWYIF